VCSRIQRAPLMSTSRTWGTAAQWRRCASCSISSSWLGTATSTASGALARSCSVRSAEKCACTTLPAPVHSPSMAPNRNSECVMLPGATMRPAMAVPKSCWLTRKLSTHDWWWRRNPLGMPVLPEVKPM